jgi:hypothetical protein
VAILDALLLILTKLTAFAVTMIQYVPMKTFLELVQVSFWFCHFTAFSLITALRRNKCKPTPGANETSRTSCKHLSTT